MALIIADSLPSLAMQAATYSGAFSANMIALSLSCSTGNCTSRIVPSLGVCGACVNVKQQLRRDCNITDGARNWSNFGSDHCKYPILDGISLTTAVPNLDERGVFRVGVGNGKVFADSAKVVGRIPDLSIANFGVLGEPSEFYF